jgi:mRNA interferase MazF
MNRHLGTIIVAPMTTQSRTYPTRVKVFHKRKPGWIVMDQLRIIDRRRIIKVLGNLTPGEIERTKKVIREALVD